MVRYKPNNQNIGMAKDKESNTAIKIASLNLKNISRRK